MRELPDTCFRVHYAYGDIKLYSGKAVKYGKSYKVSRPFYEAFRYRTIVKESELAATPDEAWLIAEAEQADIVKRMEDAIAVERKILAKLQAKQEGKP